MLNIKEVTQILNSEGITDSEKLVKCWIREGKLKAARHAQVKIHYSINPDDLRSFILEKKREKNRKQSYENNENTNLHNQRLKEEIEELRSAVRIEKAKVRCLKKMLKAEYDLSDSKPLTIHSFVGVDAAADPQAIKRELKKLLKALHPDRGGDERLFKVINDHYSKLK